MVLLPRDKLSLRMGRSPCRNRTRRAQPEHGATGEPRRLFSVGKGLNKNKTLGDESSGPIIAVKNGAAEDAAGEVSHLLYI